MCRKWERLAKGFNALWLGVWRQFERNTGRRIATAAAKISASRF